MLVCFPALHIQFEINAFGTTWSLLLNKPYADGGGEDSKRVNADGKLFVYRL